MLTSVIAVDYENCGELHDIESFSGPGPCRH